MTVLSINPQEQTESAETIVGPGAQLRKARESQGLDQARIAAELHLSETMVEALEWDDFDTLPGTVFTQGYLRNYARLLGLSEKEILAAYHRLCPEQEGDGLTGMSTVQIKQEMRSSHGLMQLASWLIVIGLISLLVVWWQGRLDWQDESGEELQTEAEVIHTPPVQEDVPFAETSVAASYVETIEEEPLVATETLSQQDIEEQPEPTIALQADNLDIEGDLQAETEPMVATVPDSISSAADTLTLDQAEPAVVEDLDTPVADDAAPQPVAQANGLLIVEFTGPCWAEVRDATGKAHILGEKRAGIRYELEADWGPFKFVLGNANAVKMTLNDEPYDLTPHTSGNVARFTLDTTE